MSTTRHRRTEPTPAGEVQLPEVSRPRTHNRPEGSVLDHEMLRRLLDGP